MKFALIAVILLGTTLFPNAAAGCGGKLNRGRRSFDAVQSSPDPTPITLAEVNGTAFTSATNRNHSDFDKMSDSEIFKERMKLTHVSSERNLSISETNSSLITALLGTTLFPNLAVGCEDKLKRERRCLVAVQPSPDPTPITLGEVVGTAFTSATNRNHRDFDKMSDSEIYKERMKQTHISSERNSSRSERNSSRSERNSSLIKVMLGTTLFPNAAACCEGKLKRGRRCFVAVQPSANSTPISLGEVNELIKVMLGTTLFPNAAACCEGKLEGGRRCFVAVLPSANSTPITLGEVDEFISVMLGTTLCPNASVGCGGKLKWGRIYFDAVQPSPDPTPITFGEGDVTTATSATNRNQSDFDKMSDSKILKEDLSSAKKTPPATVGE